MSCPLLWLFGIFLKYETEISYFDELCNIIIIFTLRLLQLWISGAVFRNLEILHFGRNNLTNSQKAVCKIKHGLLIRFFEDIALVCFKMFWFWQSTNFVFNKHLSLANNLIYQLRVTTKKKLIYWVLILTQDHPKK